MNSLVKLNFEPRFIDAGLLVLRIAVGTCLFVEHGLFKIPLLFQDAPQFPDPLLIGTRLTVAFAFLSDGIGAILALIGFATRVAVVIMIVNLTVAWGMVYQFRIEPANGELLALFLGGVAAIGLMGPGRYSVDAIWSRSAVRSSSRADREIAESIRRR